MFLAIVRMKDENGDPTNDLLKAFVEIDAAQVVENLEKNAGVEYYALSLTANNANLQKLSIRSGNRAPGKVTEVVEIEANGNVVASAEIQV